MLAPRPFQIMAPPSNSFQSTHPATSFPPQTFMMPQPATLPQLPQAYPPMAASATVGAVPMPVSQGRRRPIPDVLQRPQGFAAAPAYPSYSQVAPLATSTMRAPPLPMRTAPSLVPQQYPGFAQGTTTTTTLPMQTAPNLVASQFPGYAQACTCGNRFMDDALYCRKCGKKRQ